MQYSVFRGLVAWAGRLRYMHTFSLSVCIFVLCSAPCVSLWQEVSQGTLFCCCFTCIHTVTSWRICPAYTAYCFMMFRLKCSSAHKVGTTTSTPFLAGRLGNSSSWLSIGSDVGCWVPVLPLCWPDVSFTWVNFTCCIGMLLLSNKPELQSTQPCLVCNILDQLMFRSVHAY